MAINEEKINFSEIEYSISSKDNELLISLLNEYSNKLIYLCDKFEEKRKKDSLFKFLIPLSGGLIPLLFVTIFYDSKIDLLIKFFIYLFIIIIFVVYVIYSYFFVQNYRRHLRLLKRETHSMFLRLEKIVRTTSQVHEHSGLNSFRKLELDLRLADAESALDYYQEIINQ